MTRIHKPHSGSKGYYPRKRAERETPSFSTFPEIKTEKAKPLNFFGYKAGMTHLIAKNAKKESRAFGSNIIVPTTIIECPPLKVFGIRVYRHTVNGEKVLGEALSDKIDKHLKRRIKSIARKKKKHEIKELEKMLEGASFIVLLVHTQPYLTGIGKKKPDVSELRLSGSIDEQFNYAKEKLGNEIKLEEVFKPSQFIDVKAVTKGKGFQGVIKRFGVKQFRPKAKKRRIVGSLGPWNPSTIMRAVARPGQMGYSTRTEYNKRVVLMEKNFDINPKEGFTHYGLIKNDFVALSGSVPGAIKRCIALREPIRKADEGAFNISEIIFVATKKSERE